MIFVGIDPGKKGGICIMDLSGEVIFLEAMGENIKCFSDTMKEFKHRDAITFLEKGQVMGVGEGVVGMFNYGHHCGSLEGVLTSLDMKYELITPQAWCKVMHEGVRPMPNVKAKSKIVVQELFPDIDLKRTPRCTTIHDGMMDALLITEYGRRKWTLRRIQI